MQKKKIPDASAFVKKTTDYSSKITEIENKISTNSSLTAVENKVPNVSGLVKKTDYNTKLSETEKKITDHNHGKYITTPGFNNLTTENFKARLKQADLVTKTELDTKLQDTSKRITSNKFKHLLVENELRKLQKFDAGYFGGKNHFEKDGIQNYLVSQPVNKYFKTINSIANQNYLVSQPVNKYFETINSIANMSGWKSKGLSNESIKIPSRSNNLLNPL